MTDQTDEEFFKKNPLSFIASCILLISFFGIIISYMMAYNEACSISSWLMSECITYDKRPEQIFSNSLLGIRLGCGVFILQFVVILFFGYDEGSEDSVELDSEPQLTDSIVKTKETKFCTGCGSNRKPSANFCGNCGQDF